MERYWNSRYWELTSSETLNQIVRLCQDDVHIQSDDPEHFRKAFIKSGTKTLTPLLHHTVDQDHKSTVVLHDFTNIN